MFCETTKLESGVTVLTERLEGVRSVSLGLWVRVGNRDELPEEYGMSHFMEHMLFKGTPTRTALDISRTADALGAEFNAFTSREYTCFYTRVIDTHLDEMFQMLCDLLVNASFRPEDIELEREVVLEEIARSQDTPEDYVFDLFSETAMPTHPLGRPVLGTVGRVSAFSSDDLHAFHDAHYTTGNVFVVACGNVDHDHIVELAGRWLEGLPKGERLVREKTVERERKALSVDSRDTEQDHVLYGFPAIAQDDPHRYAYALLDTVMGGGMSSRLFTEIREKRGLAYSVYTTTQLYEDAGLFAMYAGARPDNIAEVLAVAQEQFARIAEEGITDEELDRARELTCGYFVLGQESSRNHMTRLGRMAVSGLPFLSVDETLERYRAVSRDDVARAAAHLFEQEPTVSVVGAHTVHEIEGMLG